MSLGIRARGKCCDFCGGKKQRRGRGTEDEFYVCGVCFGVPVHDCEGCGHSTGVGILVQLKLVKDCEVGFEVPEGEFPAGGEGPPSA